MTRKTTEKRKKAWLLVYWNNEVRPTFLWSRPTKDERQDAVEFGGDIYPCTVVYHVPATPKIKKRILK